MIDEKTLRRAKGYAKWRLRKCKKHLLWRNKQVKQFLNVQKSTYNRAQVKKRFQRDNI